MYQQHLQHQPQNSLPMYHGENINSFHSLIPGGNTYPYSYTSHAASNSNCSCHQATSRPYSNCGAKSSSSNRKIASSLVQPPPTAPYYTHHHNRHNSQQHSNKLTTTQSQYLPSKSTPSRLEKAKQLARHHQSSGASSTANQAYLPPSPISSTCSVSNLSSLSSSVSVSPSSLSSSPSSVFNAPSASSQLALDHAQQSSLLLSNLLPLYPNSGSSSHDYLKNLISTVLALTTYQQQQQLQQQLHYNEQIRASYSVREPVMSPTQKHHSPSRQYSKSSRVDVNAQVEEHFKRSLGAQNFNSIFKRTTPHTWVLYAFIFLKRSSKIKFNFKGFLF